MKAVSEDGSPFLYPLTGMQQLCNAFKEHLESHTEYCDIILQLYELIGIEKFHYHSSSFIIIYWTFYKLSG